MVLGSKGKQHFLTRISFSQIMLICVPCAQSLCHVSLFLSPQTVARQAPLSVHGILQVRNWSAQPFPSLGDLPDPVMKPRSPTLQADYLPLSHLGSPDAHPYPLLIPSLLGFQIEFCSSPSFFSCTFLPRAYHTPSLSNDLLTFIPHQISVLSSSR